MQARSCSHLCTTVCTALRLIVPVRVQLPNRLWDMPLHHSQVGEGGEGRDGFRDDTLQLKRFKVHAPAPQASNMILGQGRSSIESARVVAAC